MHLEIDDCMWNMFKKRKVKTGDVMSKIIKVVECYDHKVVYGYLEIENASVEEVQQKIYEIKNDDRFREECPDWCIDDVFERFPSNWKWSFISDDGNTVEI